MSKRNTAKKAALFLIACSLAMGQTAQAQAPYVYRIPISGIDALPEPSPDITAGPYAAASLVRGTFATIAAPSVAGGTAPYQFALDGGSLPAGMSVQADGSISGTPDSEGPFSAQVRISDAAGSSAVRTASGTVAPAPVQPLAIGTLSGPSYGTVNLAGQIALPSVTGGKAPYIWSTSANQSAFSFGQAQATYLFTTAGNYNATFTVTDADGTSKTSNTILVSIANPVSLGYQTHYDGATAGQAGTIPAPALGGGEAPYSMTLDSNPGGVLTPGVNGAFSYNQPAGEYGPFSVTATDARGRSKTESFTVSVKQPLAISAYQASYQGTADVQQTIPAPTVTGGTAPYAYAISPSVAGVSISSQTGEVTYTKGAGTYGPFVVTATDSAQRAISSAAFTIATEQAYTLSYNVPSPLYATLPSTIKANRTGGTGPFAYAKVSGDYPSGMTLQANGDVTGAPAASPATGTFTVRVTDAGRSNATTTATYTWNVGAINDSAIWSKTSNITHAGTASAYGLPYAQAKACLTDGDLLTSGINGKDCAGATVNAGGSAGLFTTIHFSTPVQITGVVLYGARVYNEAATYPSTTVEIRDQTGTAIGTTTYTGTNQTERQTKTVLFGQTRTVTSITLAGLPPQGSQRIAYVMAEMKWLAP